MSNGNRAYFDFRNPTVTYEKTSSVEPESQVYMFNDPFINASVSVLGQPAINSVPAQNFLLVF